MTDMPKQTEAISTERALKLALEGAANYIDALGGDSRKYRQALAEQPAQQEPVAWDNCRSEKQCRSWCGNSACGSHWNDTSPPAQRKPLMDEEILNFGPGQPDAVWSYEDQLYFARAIEAAHGIKE